MFVYTSGAPSLSDYRREQGHESSFLVSPEHGQDPSTYSSSENVIGEWRETTYVLQRDITQDVILSTSAGDDFSSGVRVHVRVAWARL